MRKGCGAQPATGGSKKKLIERAEYELNLSVGALLPGMVAPEASRETQTVIDVWNFCEGWNPERILLAAAYYGVEDVDMLVDQLLVMRRKVAEHRKAQE